MALSEAEVAALREVPAGRVYRPTAAEFASPLAYIEAIRPEAESYGVVKIIPPKVRFSISSAWQRERAREGGCGSEKWRRQRAGGGD